MKGVLVVIFAAIAVRGAVAQNCSNFPSAPSDTTNETAMIDYINLNVSCSTTGVYVKLSRCALIELGYSGNVSLFDSSGSHIRNSTCLSNVVSNYTEIEFSFANFSVCSSAYSTDGTDITYSYEVKNEEHPSTSLIITRDNLFTVDFTCVIQASYNVSYDGSISASKQVVNVTASASSGAFGEQVLLYNDSSFQYSYGTNATKTVIVPQRIYFEIYVTGADPTQYVLRTKDCWLTPTSDPSDATSYYVMTSGCPEADSTYSDANEIYLNNNSTKTQIGFRSFVWSTGETSLHIHCFYTLCDFVSNSSCYNSPNCSTSRRKRDLMDPGLDNGQGKVVTYGPIRVIAPPGACDENNGGCAYRCVPWSEDQVICTCPEGYQLNDDGKTCRHLGNGDLHVMEEPGQLDDFTILGGKLTDLEAVTYVTLVLSAILLMGMLFCVAKSSYCKRRPKEDKINFVLSPDY